MKPKYTLGPTTVELDGWDGMTVTVNKVLTPGAIRLMEIAQRHAGGDQQRTQQLLRRYLVTGARDGIEHVPGLIQDWSGFRASTYARICEPFFGPLDVPLSGDDEIPYSPDLAVHLYYDTEPELGFRSQVDRAAQKLLDEVIARKNA